MNLAGIWEYVIRRRMGVLALTVLLASLAGLLAPQLKFDRSIENMFPHDSEVLTSYRQLKRTFGGNEIVLAVYRDPDLFAPSGAGIHRVTKVRTRLAAVPGVKAVLGIDQPLPGDLIVGQTPLAQRTRELFRGYTHGADAETVSLVCMLFPRGETEVPQRDSIDGLRAVMNSLPDGLPRGYLTGEPALVVDGFRYVEQDGWRLGLWSTILLGLTITACFRSIRWVVIAVLVVQFALLLTRAALVAAQIQLSMVSSMLTAVVMVIGVATMVHVMVRFAEWRERGLSSADALRETMTQLLGPIFWACLTDAVGFLALTVSEVGPVRDFGIMMAIGSMMVLLSVLLVVPSLTLLGPWSTDPRQPWGAGRLVERLQGVLESVKQRPYRVLMGFGVLIAVSVSGIGLLRVETDFTKNFRATSDIVRSYQYVEDHLGGAGVCDVVLPAPAKLDWQYLRRVHALGQQFHSTDPSQESLHPELVSITKSFSLADALAELSPVEIEGRPRFVQNSMVYSGLTAMRGWMPEFYGALYGKDPETQQDYVRMMLRVQEQQEAAAKQRLIARLRELARAEFPEAEVTGYFVLLSRLIESVLRDQWRTFIAAMIGIGALMAIAFRDVRLAIAALIPNLFPVLVVLGSMGWISRLMLPELKINMGTAMIAAVSMGLSIDSSIHYIIGFRRALERGLSFEEALQNVQRRVGKAMVLSTLALAVGFTVLATSHFVPTVYFGVLVTLAMLGGLIGNLIGLPLLLLLLYSPHYRRQQAASSPPAKAASC